jgi:ABC-2 type transport system permease protein
LQFSVATFFSGALVPLEIMPVWLQKITLSMPFAQALYVPVSLLSGITPLSAMPQLWLTQALWLLGLLLGSRLIFRVAVRKITVQGG